ncbi:uncharacterized protein BDZ99DRAFT_299523 [Mytilinidion resinicola]|uniref:Small ribosomal subunit protein mS29 n=1 Tax=Mytilinidion resinicola TaxID=574789 RepID=A0A6A6YMV0_9PEZI|nr:uncharacterized protein BDZ99DRAFT_299523 [Mytilinidion resinicola]KAF2809903.1 hypothetical protein BDZ99DRAFT_299523 [Mytilinidion resinicola]
MPSSVCLRRLSLAPSDLTAHAMASRSLLAYTQTASFSQSAPLSAKPGQGKPAGPARGERTLNLGKNKKVQRDMGKRPAPGERKALRKRVVLSNTNALVVEGLNDLTVGNIETGDMQGQVVGLSEPVIDSLRAVEAFKATQGWHLFRRPAMLMRRETTQVSALMRDVETRKKTVRRILAGDRASGKSTLLLQGLAMAFMKKWVVISIPDAKDIVSAHTEYAPLPGSNPLQYTQNAYTANLLAQIAKANSEVLSKLLPGTDLKLPIPTNRITTLADLAVLGSKNPELSWPIFNALWTELTQPGRPPIMLAVDGLAHMMAPSAYLSAEAKPIHAHDLVVVRHFVDHLSGKSALPNGGMVLAATSGSNQPGSPALKFSVQLAEARAQGATDLPMWNPYQLVDQRVMEVLKDVDTLKLHGLDKRDARTIMEYYAASGMLRKQVDEPLVSQWWTLAGNGNIGELEKGSVKMRA